MTGCNHEAFSFSNCCKRQVRGNFAGGSISSNGGALSLREVDRWIGLTAKVASALGDRRQHGKVLHKVHTMVRQRVQAVALGYEDWRERNDVKYVVGLARNAALDREVAVACEVAKDGFEATGAKGRLFHAFEYAARSWRRSRRVISRIEHGPKGRNPRFVVTNLPGEANELYERVYCQRGDMENRIKEQQLALFADRTSSTKWWTNQYRVLLAALAYTLLETMRRTALRGTDLARAQCQTIRLRVLRIGAVVTRNTRTVAVRLSSACPDQGVFRTMGAREGTRPEDDPLTRPRSAKAQRPNAHKRCSRHSGPEVHTRVRTSRRTRSCSPGSGSRR